MAERRQLKIGHSVWPLGRHGSAWRLPRIHRLNKVVIHGGLNRLHGHFKRGVAGHQYHAGEFVLLAHFPGQFQAGRVRQLEVRHHDIELLFTQELQRARPIGRRVHRVAGILQYVLRRIENVDIIIDQEHPGGPRFDPRV